MCEFISWVEERGKVYFLTGEQLLSDFGQAWVKGQGISRDDYCGHGTIRRYYRIDEGDGLSKECTSFLTPDNFPAIIVRAIKRGEMRGLGTPTGLLVDVVEIKWRGERETVCAKWRAEWEAVDAKWTAEWDAVHAKWKAEWKAVDARFWDLFADTANRNPLWV